MSDIKIPTIDTIEEMVKDIPGWSPVEQLYTLFNLVYFTAGMKGNVVEIGSWCGRSMVVLGMAARLTGNTKVYCADLFPEKNDWHQNEDGSYSFEVVIDGRRYGGYQKQTVWKEPFEREVAPIYEKHTGVFDVFTEAVSRNNLQGLVKAYRGDSTILADSVPENFKCKLAFIDGDHSYEAVCKDIKNVERYLVKGGWICFDDAFSHYDGVNRAIEDCVINSPAYELCRQMTRKFFVARKKE